MTWKAFVGLAALLGSLPLGSWPVLGQTAPPSSPGADAGAAAAPLVTKAYSRSARFPERAGLGDEIVLEVQGLAAVLAPGTGVHCSDLVLFLDGIGLPGSKPESCTADEGRVRFLLDRTDKSDGAWHLLLAEPAGMVKTVSVSIGSDVESPFATAVRDFELEVLPRGELIAYLAILAIAVALFVRFARRSPLLRCASAAADGRPAPYSLSRFQLAFWSLLVMAAYVFIWMVTGELDTITGSVLILLGIGSGTALGAAMIDSGKPATPVAAPTVPSQGFLRDVLSDDNGVDLSRYQLFAWTLVLGTIFCASVYDGLQMPQFSTTLLGLMGLSSGTYLGFKVPQGDGDGGAAPTPAAAPEA